jgi:hypothetical protein
MHLERKKGYKKTEALNKKLKKVKPLKGGDTKLKGLRICNLWLPVSKILIYCAYILYVYIFIFVHVNIKNSKQII